MQKGSAMAARGFSIGEIAARTGLSVSAIRFYEDKGLVFPTRTQGGQRQFVASDIRRLSFIMVAQKVGLSIGDIQDVLSRLPDQRTPTKADWAKISKQMRAMLDERMALIERLRDKLDGCIGCCCLSLKACALYNPEDRAGQAGTGPRFVLSD